MKRIIETVISSYYMFGVRVSELGGIRNVYFAFMLSQWKVFSSAFFKRIKASGYRSYFLAEWEGYLAVAKGNHSVAFSIEVLAYLVNVGTVVYFW